MLVWKLLNRDECKAGLVAFTQRLDILVNSVVGLNSLACLFFRYAEFLSECSYCDARRLTGTR